MNVKPLFKIVEEHDINIIRVEPTELQAHSFEVGTQEYDLKHDWLVKGDYEIKQDPASGGVMLVCQRLEEHLDISLNRPVVNGEALLDEVMNIQVTAVVFNRHSLTMAGKEVKRRHVTAFAHACVENYDKENPQKTPSKLEDFAVFEINWEDKNVQLKSINEKPDLSTE